MKKVEISGRKVLIDNKEQILHGGEFQYFRIPKSIWRSSLEHFKNAKLNMISFYIPWIWHEFEEGKFDFTGTTLPERDLVHFLKLCYELGFNVMVRPGPYIYAEYQGFGVPEWLRQKHPEILILYENNQNSHEISLNHPVYLEYVRKWFEAIYMTLKPYIDNNMIFAWQIDNETGLPQYGLVPYISDFNPDTVIRFREHIKNKFTTVEEANRNLRTEFRTFEEFNPPLKAKGNKYQIRVWGDFIEDYLVAYLQNLKDILIDIGVDLFFYLNDPFMCQWPNNSVKKVKIAPIGFDNYTKVSTDPATHDIPFSISFAPEFYKAINNHDSPVIAAELGGGWFDPRVNVSPEATMQNSIMSIIRNVNIIAYYLLHDCIEQTGIPFCFQSSIDCDGKPTPRLDMIRKTGDFIEEYADLICNSEEKYSPVGLLKYQPHVRDMLRTSINIWSVMEDMNKALLHFSGIPALMGVLTECGYNPIVSDFETFPYEEMKKLKVVFFSSTGHVDKQSFEKLKRYVYEGGVLITSGFPILEDDFGEKFDKNPLFPAEPFSTSNSYDFGGNNILSQIAIDMVEYQVARAQIKHEMSLHTIDMMQPFSEAIRYIGKMGAWINTERGKKLWASRFVTTWKGGSGITPLLRHNDMTVGYSVRYGHGKSIFLGTLLGIFYDSPAFYNKEPAKKDSIIDFISLLVMETGVRPITNKIPNVEVVIRNLPDGMLVFLTNRGGRQDFKLETDFGFYDNIKLIFAAKESSVDGKYFEKHRVLKGVIDKDDIIGVHFY